MKYKCYLLLIVINSINDMLNAELYKWCDPYSSFCLFSFGPKITVTNLDEAQELCTEAKNDSWPLEGNGKQESAGIQTFMNIHPSLKDSKIIVNARRSNGIWNWVKSHTAVTNFTFASDENQMVYFNENLQMAKNETSFSVVCMTDCRATWTTQKNMEIIRPERILQHQRIEKCQNECETEKHHKCVAVSMLWDETKRACQLMPVSSSASIIERKGSSVYFINRTRKNVENCLNITDKNNNQDLIAYLAIAALVLGSFITTSILVYFCWTCNSKHAKDSSTKEMKTPPVLNKSVYSLQSQAFSPDSVHENNDIMLALFDQKQNKIFKVGSMPHIIDRPPGYSIEPYGKVSTVGIIRSGQNKHYLTVSK